MKHTYGFPIMADILKPREGKVFTLDHLTMNKDEVEKVQIFSTISFTRNYGRDTWGLEAGTYCRLRRGRRIMMTDTWIERRTNQEVLRKANGDVLLAGLGIGMILLPIQEKPEVRKIYVVEKEAEVIELVWDQLLVNGKCTIIQGDIHEVVFPAGTRFDTIYFDIWDGCCGDYYEETKGLFRRFKYQLNRANPNAWMGSWRREKMKREALKG